jgi:hypothetical protein
MRIQYICLIPIYVLPEMKLLFPRQNYNTVFCLPVPTLIYLWEIYIFPGSVCLFCLQEICGPILGIYKLLTDTWMWKLGLRPCNSQKGTTEMGFSLQCSGACVLTCEYLREFSKKIELTIMLFSGTWGRWFMKKPESKKSRDTVPLRGKLGETQTTTSSSFFGQLKKAVQWREENTV